MAEVKPEWLIDGVKGKSVFHSLLSKRDPRSLGTLVFLGLSLALLSILMVLLPCAMVQRPELFFFLSMTTAKRNAVIFNAWSSRSCVHIYCFDSRNELVKVKNQLEIFLHSEPWLSNFAKEPRKGEELLLPILQEALLLLSSSVQRDDSCTT